MSRFKGDTEDDHYAFSAEGLAKAYEEDEPEYEPSMIKEPNPLHKEERRQESNNTSGRIALHYFFALVWLVNGLFCKLLNLVPRHQQIVARILGGDHAALFTKTIGVLEVLMALWIISRIKPRLCTFTQVMLVATMNAIEFFLAPDLLLFGRANSVIATGFILLLLVNERPLARKQFKPTFIA